MYEEYQKKGIDMRKNSKVFKSIVLVLAAVMIAAMFSACRVDLSGYETVIFGEFEQDGKLENGQEPLEWIILERTADEVVMATKYGVFAKDYYIGSTKKGAVVSWDDSSLRKWVRNTFYKKTFSDEQKKYIIDQEFTDEVTGKKLKDHVSLLTVEEAQKYFPSNKARLLEETEYANLSKAYKNTFTQSGWWWLRDMGEKEGSAAFVNSFGAIITGGNYACYEHALVRLIVHIKPEALQQ